MFTQVWKAARLLFHWKASEGVHEHPEPVCKFVCVCVFTPLLEEAEPYFSLGLGGWSQNNTDSNSVKTSVETPGSSLSVPSQYPDFPSENLQFSLQGRHLPSFLSFWALHGIELHVVVSFLLLEVQCEQLFYYRNVWFECLRAKDLIYAAT